MATALNAIEQIRDHERLARSLWFLGGLITIHIDSAQTNGAFSLIEAYGPPGGEPPLHVHANEDECFHLLEGKLKVFRGEDELVLEPGDTAFLPRSVPHTFKILSNHARWLGYITPGGFENYFRRLGKPAQYLAPERAPAPPDLKAMIRVGHEYGISFLRPNSSLAS